MHINHRSKQLLITDVLDVSPSCPDLPVEVWILIFARLDVISLVKLSRVSHKWTKITNDHTLWRNLCIAHQISLEDDESKRLFAEYVLADNHLSAWKKLFIRHFKNEQRNRILGKLFWAGYEANGWNQFLNTTQPNRPRMLTYNGQAARCPQCEREKDLLNRMEITTRHGIY